MRKHFIVQGRVQGVGFRYTTLSEATLLGLGGWVRNLSNGDVEMEVEGGEEEINQLLQILKEKPFIIIESLEEETVQEEGETKFRIR